MTPSIGQSRKHWVWRIAVIALVGLLGTAGLMLAFYATNLPPPTGTFPVGRKSYVFTDPNRAETWVDDANAKRRFVVYLWYPAVQPDRAQTATYYPELRDLGHQFKWYERFVLGSVRSPVLADAQLAPSANPYPVLLFSPGAGNPTHFYTSILAELASHGFVVAAMEHTYEGQGQVFPDGKVVGPESRRKEPRSGSATFQADFAQFYRQRVDIRARDAAFVLDELTRLGKDDPLLGGRIDLTRVGIFGHSIGGVSAAEAARRDRRIKATANLDGLVAGQPVYFEPGKPGIGSPFLYLGKPINEPLKAKQDVAFRSMEQESYRVLLPGTSHDSFSDTPLLTPGGKEGKTRTMAAVRAFLSGFFGKYLLGQDTTLFDGPTEKFPGVSVERFAPARH